MQQHYAALTRDPSAAKAVNLEPQNAPQDAYMEVAKLVRKFKPLTFMRNFACFTSFI